MSKHIVIDGRIRRASTGRPIDRFLHHLEKLDDSNKYTVLLDPSDTITFKSKNISTLICNYPRFSMNPINQIGFSWQLYKLNPDLVFFTMTGLAPLFYFGKNIALTHDLTMLRFVRAGRLPEWLHQIRMVGYRLLFWKGNKFSSKVIVPTNFVKQDLTNYSTGLRDKIKVIYEAGDLPVKDKSQKPKNINEPFILHVGSPFPHKNISNLILAFEKLKPKNPDLNLVLAGKKEYYFEELESWLKNREYSKDIIITGYVEDSELKWLYENAECYILPSLSEGFGLPGLEAMAYGCPLVSSNATCLPEVYGQAAEYFDPNNVDDIKNKVEKVLSDKNLQKTLISAGKKQLDKYSWEKMTNEILDVIYTETKLK